MAVHRTFIRIRIGCTLWALAAGLALQALAAGLSAAAEVALRDPTQPPAPVVAVAAAASRATAAAPVWPRLQAVKVSATGGSSALIDGRLVHVGERVGGLNLAAVDAHGVLLRGTHFDQEMALFPGVVKVASKVRR